MGIRYCDNQSVARMMIQFHLLLLSTTAIAQTKMVGKYRDYFGNRIEIKSDSTFKYTWRFDLQSSWTKGTWRIRKDTVYFQMVAVYDTIRYTNRRNLTLYTLILSSDEVSERISNLDSSFLLLYGQNYHGYPDKLFFRKGKLYNIYKGSLVKRKQKSFWTSKKWRPWYFKSDD